MLQYPEMCYSHDQKNNCIILKWGDGGYYKTDYPEGRYTDEVIDQMNERADISPEMRRAMEICSMAAQNNPALNWKKHYEMVLDTQNNIRARRQEG